jgi:hypothetical protein
MSYPLDPTCLKALLSTPSLPSLAPMRASSPPLPPRVRSPARPPTLSYSLSISPALPLSNAPRGQPLLFPPKLSHCPSNQPAPLLTLAPTGMSSSLLPMWGRPSYHHKIFSSHQLLSPLYGARDDTPLLSILLNPSRLSLLFLHPTCLTVSPICQLLSPLLLPQGRPSISLSCRRYIFYIPSQIVTDFSFHMLLSSLPL